MRLPDECGVITNRAIRGGVLDECAENGVVEFEPRVIVDLDLDAKRLRAGLNDGNSLGMTIVGDEKFVSTGSDRMTKRHRFGGGGRFVQKRRVCDIEPSQIGRHRLEIYQRLQTALRQLGLVRGVSSIPAGIFENVSLDNRRRNAVVVARADK